MFNIFKRKKTKRFGEIAIDRGLASEEDVKEALQIQQKYEEKHKVHKEIGAIMTEKGILTPNDVKSILDEQKGQASTMAWFTALFGLSR
jgi:mannitol/fructose-specific phosphotransferase system IIA component (Ntr-type)